MMSDPNLIPEPEIELDIIGMDCANCALTLERGVAQLEGVREVQVNFTAAKLRARGSASAEVIADRIRALGYDVSAEADRGVKKAQEGARQRGTASFARYLLSERQMVLALVAAALLLVSLLLGRLLSVPAGRWVVLGLHLVAIVLAGYPIARKGVRSFLVSRQITIDLLMTIATIGALAIGESGEAATVSMLFAIGEALEGYTAERARDSLRSLLSLAPDEATVMRPCIDCAEHMGRGGYAGGVCPFCGMHEAVVPVEQVAVGETVLVRPGQRIPVDGRVTGGVSSVNQAPVTGESIPVAKSVGDEVFAGTINGEGALEIEVLRAATDSTISRIVRLVEQAQAQRAPAERFIDRFARWYTPAVVLVAVLVATVPPLLFGQPFVVPSDPAQGWLYRALALLIVACPCALVISTPVTVVSTLSGLARQGVLVKGGVFLDALARLKVFAFDKTGTLTEGRPVVVQTRTPICPPGSTTCEACDDLLALAASVERRSEHPLARAIVSEADGRGLAHRYAPADGVQALAGQGVKGVLEGETVMVGSHALFHNRGVACAGMHPHIEAAEASGQTVLMVSRGGAVQGFVAVADLPRATSQAALRDLKAIDPAFRLVMLTGDNPAVAKTIAEAIGSVDEVRAGLLPADKLEAVRTLRDEYGAVAMIGDGVNDAPALAQATVGVAMGGAGTAQAMETADVVLMQDDLTHLPNAVHASRRARRIIVQNIAFSLAIKAAFLLLALPGLATMWMAVFADMGASLLVTLNGMRMLRNGRG